MEREIITTGGGLLCFGLLFIWLGFSGWKHRREERNSVIESALLKLGKHGPLPYNRWDRAMAYVQPVLMLIFGPTMIFLGLLVLIA